LRKIKVLFTIPNFDTAGSGNVIINLANGLDKEFFDVEICTSSDKGVLLKKINHLGIKVHIFNYLTTRKLGWDFVKGTYNTFQFFRKCNPDIIHSYHYASEFSEGLAARLAGCKWVFTKKNMAWGNKSWKIRSFLANRIISTNKVIKSKFYNNSNKIEVIYSSVNTANFTFVDKKEIKRNFIVVGNIIPIKGTEYIIKAFLAFCELNPGKLILVGDDSSNYAANIKQTLITNKYKDRIEFVGKSNTVKNYFDDCFCLIMASESNGEGGPVAVLEAMSYGLLVIGSNVAGINEQLSNFPDLMFNPEDSESLLKKMIEVFNYSDKEIKNSTKKLRFELESRFTIDIEIKKHQKFYQNLLG